MKHNIIIINGLAGAGKDTFVSLCKQFIDNNTFLFNTSMVDGVKDIASIVGWNGTKEQKDRRFLSDLKDLLEEYNNFPMQCVKQCIDIFQQSVMHDKNTKSISFIHAREPSDIDRLKATYSGARSLIVKRDNAEYVCSNHADNPDTILNYHYDIVINNNGSLEDLANAAKGFIEELIKD